MNTQKLKEILIDILISIIIFFLVFAVFEIFSSEPIEWKALFYRSFFVGILYTLMMRIFFNKRVGNNKKMD